MPSSLLETFEALKGYYGGPIKITYEIVIMWCTYYDIIIIIIIIIIRVEN